MADIQAPPPTCGSLFPAPRVSTTHHLSLLGGAATGGVLNAGQWFPSAAGQHLELGVPLDQGAQVDQLTVRGVDNTHAFLAFYRLDHAAIPPTFLGAFSLTVVAATGETTWELATPHQVSTSVELVGSEVSSYFVDITSGTGGEGFGPATVTTSVQGATSAPSTPGC